MHEHVQKETEMEVNWKVSIQKPKSQATDWEIALVFYLDHVPFRFWNQSWNSLLQISDMQNHKLSDLCKQSTWLKNCALHM